MYSKELPVKGLKHAVGYNERKVDSKKAERILAGNFLPEAADLSRAEIRSRLKDATALNHRAAAKVIHLIVSFSPADRLDNKRLARIAMDYMKIAGYGRQPYVVYRHLDTIAPHLHIVGANIGANGKHIGRHYTGVKGFYAVDVALIEKYGLVNAKNEQHALGQIKTPAQQIRYGEQPTAQAIGEVVQYVRRHYRFRSLAELNAILRHYRVIASTGLPGSRLHDTGGLIYKILDENGKSTGGMVKASKVPGKPILLALKDDFQRHLATSPPALSEIKMDWELALLEGATNNGKFHDALRRRQLALAPDVDAFGKVTGLLIVDWAGKRVVKADEIGWEMEDVKKRLGYEPLEPAAVIRQSQEIKQRKRGRGI